MEYFDKVNVVFNWGGVLKIEKYCCLFGFMSLIDVVGLLVFYD